MTQTPPQPRRAGPFLAWVWAGLLIAGGLWFLGRTTGLIQYGGPLVLILAVGVALLALPFVARWLVYRDEWWAALTAWVFLSMAILMMTMFFNPANAQIVGVVALAEIALPFGAIYVSNRERWWALIPFYTLAVLAGLLALTMFNIPLRTLGAFGLLAAALPFWLVYFANRDQWWALIPAGALSAVGALLLVVFTLLRPGTGTFYVFLNAALAAVCVAVWLAARRFDWALWLAVGFGLAAGLSIWFPSSANWALVALALGVYIAFRQIAAAQKAKSAPQPAPQPASAPPPPQPAIPNPPAPPAQPAPPPGLLADREVTAGSQNRPVNGSSGPSPVVDFRPLDPFKARREQQAEEDDENAPT